MPPRSSVSASVIDQVVERRRHDVLAGQHVEEALDYADKGLYFRLGPSDILQGQVLSEVIAEDGNSQHRASSTSTTTTATAWPRTSRPRFEAGGGEVVDTITYDPQAQTFDAEVQRGAGG